MSGTLSPQTGSLLAALAYAGIGAGVGSIGAALITAKSGKTEARAHAADLLSEAAGGLADRLAKNNAELDGNNKELKRKVAALTDAIDILLPYLVQTLPADVLAEIKKINLDSKLSL